MATLRSTAVATVAAVARRVAPPTGRGRATTPATPIDVATPIAPLFAPLPAAPGDAGAVAGQLDRDALPKLPAAMVVLLGGH